jgi:hypothetical protein
VSKDSARLLSPYKDMAWNAIGPTTATCDLQGRHHAPSLRCTCGLYACYSLRDAAPQALDEATVLGAVLGWGRAYLHANGWRAERAQPLCITYLGPPRKDNLFIARLTHLPLVSGASVERYALEFGVDGSVLYAQDGTPAPDA